MSHTVGMRAVGLGLRALLAVLLVLPLPGLVSGVSIDVEGEWRELPSSTREFAFARRHLHQGFDGYGPTEVFAGAFGVVALSHFAAGLMNVYVAEPARRDEVLGLLDEVVRRAKSPKVAPSDLIDDRPIDASVRLDDHNLYFSHLALILGVRRLVACAGERSDRSCTVDPREDALQSRLANHLRARTLASPLHHAPSYPDSDMWPADQSVTLVALRLHDEAFGTHLLDAPLAGYLATMEAHTDPATQLFHSAVIDSTTPIVSVAEGYAKTPRGCAASWTQLYLAQVAPDVARAQYTHYRKHMNADVLGFGGFREWPSDRAQGMDADSGPIVLGVGMAATGLGLGPARLFGDVDRYATIRRTALTFGVPSWIPSHGYVTAPVLGEAILFHGRTARPWFAAPPAAHPPAARGSTFSFASLALFIGYATFAAMGIRRLWTRRGRSSVDAEAVLSSSAARDDAPKSVSVS
jgi:hypothetical protein